jgi:NitT/TauT family transport system ATP-binding protein
VTARSVSSSDGRGAVEAEVSNVSKVYTAHGEVEALRSLSFSVGAGEFVSVLGPSGCGKSTLLMMIAGLRRPTSGSVSICGRPVEGPHTGLGIVFETPLLLEWRDTLGNVLLQIDARRLRRADYRERALELLASVGLAGWEARYPRDLSGGMQQRVALCRALIHDPPLLLMDEPFGRLDALTREQMTLDLHRIWYQRAKTVVFVTHSIREAVFLSDRIVVLTPRPGRIARMIDVEIPHPRTLSVQDSEAFKSAVSETTRTLEEWGVLREGELAPTRRPSLSQRRPS